MPSFSRSQAARFAGQGAAQNREVNGQPFTWSGQPGATFCGAFTALQRRRDIEAGGFEVQPDAVLRVQASIYPRFLPANGQKITVAGELFMITVRARPMGVNAEWRLDLGKA